MVLRTQLGVSSAELSRASRPVSVTGTPSQYGNKPFQVEEQDIT